MREIKSAKSCYRLVSAHSLTSDYMDKMTDAEFRSSSEPLA